MAQRNGAGGRRGSGARGASGRGSPTPSPRRRPSPAPPTAAPRSSVPAEPRVLRLGAIPGATPGKWLDRWNERMPDVAIELVPLAVSAQRAALDAREVDAAIVRRPIDERDLHVIPLYDEIPVVVMSADSELTVADELEPRDLEGAVVIRPLDDVLGPLDLPGTTAPRFAPLETTADAIATAASGVGVVVVPMSLARLHQRKDAASRPLVGGPLSSVAFAWPRAHDSADIQAFVGIIRGRTARSSR